MVGCFFRLFFWILVRPLKKSWEVTAWVDGFGFVVATTDSVLVEDVVLWLGMGWREAGGSFVVGR